MDEFISLKRDEDHASFTKETFRSLLNTGDYADSTLVDGCNIRTNAHKVILGQQVSSSGATPTSNPHRHPMIYLMISNRDMVALLSFIYEGKCVLVEACINDFMEIASDLGIMPDEHGEEGEVVVVKKKTLMSARPLQLKSHNKIIKTNLMIMMTAKSSL